MYNYEIYYSNGQLIVMGECNSRTIEKATELINHLIDCDEILEIQRDKQEHNCWSYDATVRYNNDSVESLIITIK